ncbi:hypothetical protein EDC15_11646 [Acetobacter aceti NBRC 14818]|nr:hypothetical protein EDC15_11646 [Acetobacter aceti NBRC 14818]
MDQRNRLERGMNTPAQQVSGTMGRWDRRTCIGVCCRFGGDGATGRCYHFLESTTTRTCARMSKAFIAAVLQDSLDCTGVAATKAADDLVGAIVA